MFKIFKKKNLWQEINDNASLKEAMNLGVVAGLSEVAYIALVVVFMLTTQGLFSPEAPAVIILGMFSFLILFVISGAVSLALLFAKPLSYFEQKKTTEALICFNSSLLTMFVLFALVLILAGVISWL